MSVPTRRAGGAVWPGTAALLLALVLVATACKTPRPPHRTYLDDVSGSWAAQSREPVPAGWGLQLQQRDGGRILGNGSLTRETESAVFPIRGIRGPHEITLAFHLEPSAARFDGSVMGAEQIVGRLYLDGDTIYLTFSRQ
jgi:hypothetical protein